MSRSHYLPELDGLRAVAVISVLLNHIKIPFFNGGYIGVDIFFVLSGFLITGLIVDEAKGGHFSLMNFYARRAKRLLPALYVTLAASFMAAFLFFQPQEMAAFCSSLVHSLLSISNVYFWLDSGYFSPASILKPLLHTWSLSVEEQFYALWPIPIVYFSRKGVGPTATFIFVLFASSLGLNILFQAGPPAMLQNAFPGLSSLFANGPSSIFYLLPFRAFEFAIGASLIYLRQFTPSSNALREITMTAGLASIGFAIYTYDESTLFPSINALLPCFGTAAVIYAQSTRFTGLLLTNRLSIFWGKISYSLYLVHWPIIVFHHYLLDGPLTVFDQLMMLVISFTSSRALHEYVEKKFRYSKSALTPWNLLKASHVLIVLLSVMAIPAIYGWTQGGFAWRFSSQTEEVVELNVPPSEKDPWLEMRNHNGLQYTGKGKKVLFIGDSQSGDLLNLVLTRKEESNLDISSIVVNGVCGVVLPEDRQQDEFFEKNEIFQARPDKITYRGLCPTQWNSIIRHPNLKEADLIIIASLWKNYHVPYLHQTLKKIRNATSKRIVLVGPKTFELNSMAIAKKCNGKNFWFSTREPCSVQKINKSAVSYVTQESQKLDIEMKRITKANAVEYLSMLSIICPNGSYCKAFTDDGLPIYYDEAHFAKSAASAAIGLEIMRYF